MPAEHVHTIDGADLTWDASVGELFCEVRPFDCSREPIRWVWQPENLAAILLRTLTSKPQSGVRTLALIAELTRYMDASDALDAEATG